MAHVAGVISNMATLLRKNIPELQPDYNIPPSLLQIRSSGPGLPSTDKDWVQDGAIPIYRQKGPLITNHGANISLTRFYVYK